MEHVIASLGSVIVLVIWAVAGAYEVRVRQSHCRGLHLLTGFGGKEWLHGLGALMYGTMLWDAQVEPDIAPALLALMVVPPLAVLHAIWYRQEVRAASGCSPTQTVFQRAELHSWYLIQFLFTVGMVFAVVYTSSPWFSVAVFVLPCILSWLRWSRIWLGPTYQRSELRSGTLASSIQKLWSGSTSVGTRRVWIWTRRKPFESKTDVCSRDILLSRQLFDASRFYGVALPGQLAEDLAPEAISAAVAVKLYGLREGLRRWVAAEPGPERTAQHFASALFAVDSYLAGGDPKAVRQAYANSSCMKNFLDGHGIALESV